MADDSPAARRSRRPPARDPARTRARILEAATAEFAAHGLSGARVDRIARRAGANKRMIYHYFGSKDDLFLAVLESAYGAIRAAERGLDLEHLEPSEAIRRLIAFTWRYFLDHPEFLRLVNSENLHRASHLERSTVIREMHSPFVKMVADVLARGEAAGVFRAGVDPVQLNITIAALGYYYLTNRHTSSIIYDRDLMAPEALDARLAFITENVLGYLRP